MPRIKVQIILIALLTLVLGVVFSVLVSDMRDEVYETGDLVLDSNRLANEFDTLALVSKDLITNNPRAVQQWHANYLKALERLDDLDTHAVGEKRAQVDTEIAELRSGLARVNQISERIRSLETLNRTLPAYLTRVLDQQLSSEVEQLAERTSRISESLVVGGLQATDELTSRFAAVIGAFVCVITITLFCLGFFVIKRLGHLNEVVSRFKDGDLSARLSPQGNTELDRAFRLFDSMAESIDTSRQQLLDYSGRLELAAELSQLGIWEWDVTTDQIYWDDRMNRLVGQQQNDALDIPLSKDNWLSRIHPDDRAAVERSLNEALHGGSRWESEYRFAAGQGQYKQIYTAAVLQKNSAGKLSKMTGIAADVTKDRELEARLRQAIQNEQKANRAKSEFLANMSHEIRTPMNGVIGMIDLLQSTPLNARQYEYLGMIKNSSSSLLSVLNDVLDLSKIEVGRLDICPEPISVEHHVGNVVKGFALEAHNKGLGLHLRMTTNGVDCLEVDPTRLSQILFNLIGNAIKFTAEGEIVVDVNVKKASASGSVNRSGQDDQYKLSITVSDTGIGIAKERLDEIKRPFVQADSSISRSYGGTGLGLSIVGNLVSLMNGQVIIDSDAGVGTRVSLTVPVVTGETTDSPYVGVDFQRLSNNTPLRLLSVNSNPGEQDWLGKVADSWSFDSHAASSVAEALDCFERALANNQPISILLLDSELPDGRGADVIRRLKQRGINLPDVTVLLATQPTEADLAVLSNAGIQGCVTRPFTPSDLYNRIASAMMGTPPEHEPDAPTSVLHRQADRRLNVLVAEDNPINQRLVQDILEARGHSVTLAGNGRLALSLALQQNFDVILMDVQMPEMDGYEATGEIRKAEAPDAAKHFIVGLTANALKGDKEACLQAGMDEYLSKPVLAQTLVEMVETRAAARLTQDPTSEPGADQTSGYQFFSVEKGLLVAGQSKALLEKVAGMLSDLLPGLLEEMEEMVRAGDENAAAARLHKLKGMIANLANDELVARCASLEAALKDPQTLRPFPAWSDLRKDITCLVEEVEQYLKFEGQVV